MSEFDGLGVVSLDVELHSFLEDGFIFIRNNPTVIDEIFSHFRSAHLERLYGQREIEKIKKWVTTNDIYVVMSWSLNPQKLPSVSVHMAHSEEAVQWAGMDDYAGMLLGSDGDIEVVVDSFVPAAYDTTNGIITVTDSTDISRLKPGHIVVDGSDEEWLIESPIGDNYFAVNTTLGSDVDISKLLVKSGQGTITKRKLGQAQFRELIDIGLHGHADQHTVMWLYYIVSWLLFRFKTILEKRCFDVHTFSASDFDRDSKYLGEHVYSRWLRLSGKTSISWREPPYTNITRIDTATLDSNGDIVEGEGLLSDATGTIDDTTNSADEQ